MTGLTKNQLAEMVKDLRGQFKELACRYSELQNQHIKLQMDFMQVLGKKLDRLEKRAGKSKFSLPQKKGPCLLHFGSWRESGSGEVTKGRT